MKTIIFAPAVFNLGETTRMVEVAKELRKTAALQCHCIFIGFSQTYANIIEKEGFTYHLST